MIDSMLAVALLPIVLSGGPPASTVEPSIEMEHDSVETAPATPADSELRRADREARKAFAPLRDRVTDCLIAEKKRDAALPATVTLLLTVVDGGEVVELAFDPPAASSLRACVAPLFADLRWSSVWPGRIAFSLTIPAALPAPEASRGTPARSDNDAPVAADTQRPSQSAAIACSAGGAGTGAAIGCGVPLLLWQGGLQHAECNSPLGGTATPCAGSCGALLVMTMFGWFTGPFMAGTAAALSLLALGDENWPVHSGMVAAAALIGGIGSAVLGFMVVGAVGGYGFGQQPRINGEIVGVAVIAVGWIGAVAAAAVVGGMVGVTPLPEE